MSRGLGDVYKRQVQRGGLPRVAAQDTRFGHGKLARDQRVIRRGIAWGRRKGMRRYRRGGRVAVVKAVLQGWPCAGRKIVPAGSGPHDHIRTAVSGRCAL